MRNCWFPLRKAGIFSPGKEIKGLRGGPHPAFGHPLPEGEGKLYPFSPREKDRMRGYAAQARPKIDAARGKKHPFRTETS